MPSNRLGPALASLLSRSPRDLGVIALIFALLGVAGTWPLATDLAGTSVSGPANNDVFLNQYLLFWGTHALTTAPTSLYHPNMFHPTTYTFAYADMLISSSLLLAPVILGSGNPTLAYNLLLLSSIVIGGLGMYVLAGRFVPRWAALCGALVFVFNPLHFSRYRQPQLFTDHWLPWLVWALLLWLETCGIRHRACDRAASDGAPQGSLRWAGLAAALFCLHALTGSHNAIFGTLVCGVVLLYYALHTLLSEGVAGLRTRRLVIGTALGVAICVGVLAPAFYPYAVVGDQLRQQRIGSGAGVEAVLDDGSARLQELLLGTSRFHQWVDSATGWPTALVPSDRDPQGQLFPGVVMLTLAAAGVLLGATRSRTRARVAATLDTLSLLTALLAFAALFADSPWLGLLGVRLSLSHTALLVVTTGIAITLRARFAPGEPHVLKLAWRRARDAWTHEPEHLLWSGFAIACLLLALGPATWLYGLVQAIPGAQLIRVPRRFLMPGAFAAALLAARGALYLGRRRGGRAGLTLAVMMVLFLAESWHAPLPTAPAPYPREPIHEWLADQPGDFAVLELPIDYNPTAATRQMIGSVYHWKKLLVGYSGAVPPGYFDFLDWVRWRFPAPEVLDALRERDVRFLILIEPRATDELRAAVESSPDLRLARQLDGIRVYEILPGDEGD